jgi:hypothetical protein
MQIAVSEWLRLHSSKNTPGFTCDISQSCDANDCASSFNSDGSATCKTFGAGCTCVPTSAMCGNPQSCDANGCAGSFDSNGKATCKGAFATCQCDPTSNTCETPQSCDANGCAGAFNSNGVATCQNNFIGCRCIATSVSNLPVRLARLLRRILLILDYGRIHAVSHRIVI